MAYNPKVARKYQVVNKCEIPCDMGLSIQFADPIPGTNNTEVRPFGWTEYDASYRPMYVPLPGGGKVCRDPCKARVDRKPPPKEYMNPCLTGRRRNACELCHQAQCNCAIPPPWRERKEKVTVYDPDSVRRLIVHGEVKNEHPLILSNCDYAKVLSKATAKSKEEKLAECEAALQQKRDQIQASRQLADQMRSMDKANFNASISPEAQQIQAEVCGRARSMVLDDEPEMRAINQVILAAKVQAIREAQLEEKKLILSEQQAEEERVLAAIAQNPPPFLKNDVVDAEEEERRKKEFAESLAEQLKGREASKYLEKLEKEHEREEMKRCWEEQEMQDLADRNAKLVMKHQLGQQLLENQMLQVEQKKQMKALDMREDEQMLEWLARKEEEQQRFNELQEAKRKQKEMQIDQVFTSQLKLEESKRMREDLRMKRHQEQQEREWRNRERNEILKKQQVAQELKHGLLGQIQLQHQISAEEAAIDKALVEKLFHIQNEKFEQEKGKGEELKLKKAQYQFELREQIHKFQLQKIQERKDHFVEGIVLRKDMTQREADIRAAMSSKLNELRASNLPAKYVKYVQKAIDEHLKPPHMKSVIKQN